MKEGLRFEDFSVEGIYRTNARTVTEADLANFVGLCAFYEPLFTDREFVDQQTHFKKPIVPGALTFCFAEGLSILSGILHRTGMAFMSLEMQLLKPVFIGDTISVEIEVVEKRETSKPDRGIVTFAHKVRNQNEEVVIEYTVKRMIRRKTVDKP
jgi:acyl dehydratase